MPKKGESLKEKTLMEKIGPWSFILGLVIAAISAFTGNVFWMLGILGVLVGLLNVSDRESSLYLIASITFLVSTNALSVTLTKLAALVPIIVQWLNFIDPLLANITLFVAPGAALVALKALYNLSKD